MLLWQAENDNLKAQLVILKADVSGKSGSVQLDEQATHRKLEQQADAVRLAHTEMISLKAQATRCLAARSYDWLTGCHAADRSE